MEYSGRIIKLIVQYLIHEFPPPKKKDACLYNYKDLVFIYRIGSDNTTFTIIYE